MHSSFHDTKTTRQKGGETRPKKGEEMYEAEYKVRYERFDGFHVSDWDNEKGARKFFEDLKNERVRHTIWAELCFASIKDDAVDEVVVVDDFTRQVVEIMGKKLIV